MSETEKFVESSEEELPVEKSSVVEAESGVDDVANVVEDAEPEPEAAEPPQSAILKVDLNTATEAELQRLPGIGKALAVSIVGYRETKPFREPAEVTAVPGISDTMYKRFADLVTASRVEPEAGVEVEEIAEPTVPEAESADLEPEPEVGDSVIPEPEIEVEEITEPTVPEAEAKDLEPEPEVSDAVSPEPEIEVVEEEEAVLAVEQEEPPVGAAPMRRPEPPPLVKVERIRDVSWGRLLSVGFVSVLLGVLLALAALFLVNGTLDFQTAANRALKAEVNRLEGEMQALDAKLGGLDERLTAMQDLAPIVEEARANIQSLGQDLAAAKAQLTSVSEELSGVQSSLVTLGDDVAELEKGFSVMGDELSALQAQTDDLQTQITTMEENLAILQEASERFDAFLAGLRALLSDVEPPVHSAPGPFPTPTAWMSTTPEPNVTVIPLATPTAKP